MDTSHSQEGELGILPSDAQPTDHSSNSSASKLGSGLQALCSGLQALSLDDNAQVSNRKLVELFKRVGGKWERQDKLISYKFIREGYKGGDEEGEEEEGEDDNWRVDKNKSGFRSWVLKVGSKVRGRVDNSLSVQFYYKQLRADFVNQGVWAFRFMNREGYLDFVAEFRNCLFENTYLLEATKQNKLQVFGKDFMAWDNPQAADDSVWEDTEESSGVESSGVEEEEGRDLKEELEEADHSGIQSLAMGALDHSFLVSETGIKAIKNFHNGIHGKGMSVRLSKGELGGDESSYATPKKGLLIRAETNMMLMSPSKKAEPHAAGVHQMDIETGKIVTEWKFEKDGTAIMMRDIANGSKGAQLDASESTFMGLDDNRLCRWDMRDKQGIVQETGDTVLSWADGHQFSRGTDFQCFATTGDGCVVVGSSDGKIRLYGKTSMRMAKTAFPGLGSPITHVDVTYDGKWIIGTTDTYLILISTLFTDKDGKTKTGFSGRMGSKIPAPRLLKLKSVDAYHAGNNKFHGGQFSWVTESGKQERHLVAAIGNFSVIWNFQQVKNSEHACYKGQEGLKSCYCYKIVPKDESIVDVKFMHDKFAITNSPEAPLVVATPKKVSSFSIGS